MTKLDQLKAKHEELRETAERIEALQRTLRRQQAEAEALALELVTINQQAAAARQEAEETQEALELADARLEAAHGPYSTRGDQARVDCCDRAVEGEDGDAALAAEIGKRL